MLKWFFLSSILFIVGFWGCFLNRLHFILILLSLELMLLGINLNFLVASSYMDDLSAQLFSLFILTVAAAEAAIGLAILVIYYRLQGSILVTYISLLKG